MSANVLPEISPDITPEMIPQEPPATGIEDLEEMAAEESGDMSAVFAAEKANGFLKDDQATTEGAKKE